jgi:DNA recombination protein RmuC
MAIPVWAVFLGGALSGGLAVMAVMGFRLRGTCGELSSLRLEAVRMEERLRAQDEECARLSAERAGQEGENDALREDLGALQSERSALKARMEEQAAAAESRLALLEEARTRLSEAFQALSREALETNSRTFLQLAGETLGQKSQAIDQVVQPLKESLGKVESAMREIETKREGAYGSLTEQIRGLSEAQLRLQGETANLVKALRQPQVRGRWGEIQLRRVVELAGMIEHCDFEEQVSVTRDEGRLRPDLIVALPNERIIVVDAKVPLEAYMEAIEAQDEAARSEMLKNHGRQIRDHISRLAAKDYWKQFDRTPDFVVLFLPGESFMSAAAGTDLELIEYGAKNRVLLATPTTLLALLKAVAYGWNQEAVARSAKAISETGRELHDRLKTFLVHFEGVRKGLKNAGDSYNKAVGSLESRVLVSARRLANLNHADEAELGSPSPMEIPLRSLAEFESPLEEEPPCPAVSDEA